jgi:hypothetical protein
MARIADGDARAFTRVYDAHRGRVFRVAYGVLLDGAEAREAVQEAFFRLHLAAPRWEPRARIGTWLYRVRLEKVELGTALRALSDSTGLSVSVVGDTLVVAP